MIFVISFLVSKAYFFCRYNQEKSLKAQVILGTIARQILQTLPDFERHEPPALDPNSSLTTEEIINLLSQAVPSYHRVFLVVDGLDECTLGNRQLMMNHLHNLQSKFPLILYLSIRLEPDTEQVLEHPIFRGAGVFKLPESNNPDIHSFVNSKLDEYLESGQLNLGDPHLIIEVRNTLLERSKGMFLWVSLQIEALSMMQTDEAIRNALANLPKDLSGTFLRILERSGQNDPSEIYQKHTLELIFAALRPLTTEELHDALSVTPGNADWAASRLINDILSTLRCCGGLLIVDEEDSTVQMAHHSVKLFLERDGSMINFSLKAAKTKMADVIITYLAYGYFDKQLSTNNSITLEVSISPTTMASSAIAYSTSVRRKIAQSLLRSKDEQTFMISTTIAPAASSRGTASKHTFPFSNYTNKFWPAHIGNYSVVDRSVKSLLDKIINSKRLDVNEISHDVEGALLKSIRVGDATLTRIILHQTDVDVETMKGLGKLLLDLADESGDEDILDLILQKEYVSEQDVASMKPSAFLEACKSGHSGFITKRLENTRATSRWIFPTTYTHGILLVTKQGHTRVIKLLVDTLVELNLISEVSNDKDLVLASNKAFNQCHGDILEILCNANAIDLNKIDWLRRSTRV